MNNTINITHLGKSLNQPKYLTISKAKTVSYQPISLTIDKAKTVSYQPISLTIGKAKNYFDPNIASTF